MTNPDLTNPDTELELLADQLRHAHYGGKDNCPDWGEIPYWAQGRWLNVARAARELILPKQQVTT